ncbi:hypothetical protein BRADI_1g47855v3 [Brachypodium distachyon]|uniref:Uncharacterized protein n=1 Tax=Brachypodium distachyon TaxID=15368 RepID=A0A0Q3K4E9_BRADI|nr:hypothetical protein BRADI_1g47855v3 [Brachypodium distachyon]
MCRPTPPSDPTASIPFRPFSFTCSLMTPSSRLCSKMSLPPRCSPSPRENCRRIRPPRSSSRPHLSSLPPSQRHGNAPPSIFLRHTSRLSSPFPEPARFFSRPLVKL